MNPYDAINNDTKKNYDNQAKKAQKAHNHETRPKNNREPTKQKSKSIHKPAKRNTITKRNTMTRSQEARLKHAYSTDRINVYVLLHLKALQIISGDKSRSDLEEKMIRIVEPKIVNSASKRAKYRQLLKYAIKGVELKNQMK